MIRNGTKTEKKWRAGILGATGVVGQRLVQLLADHPWFEVTEVAASERSAGKKYREAAQWRLETPVPERVGELVVKEVAPKLECDFVFSALDSSVAGPAEEEFASAGYPVVSNSRNHRMDGDVPLVIPEVNAGHLAVIAQQQKRRGVARGFIVTNPNCSTAGLALALKPIHDAFGIEQVFVVTLQAISGAGHPGVASLDIYDNVIPFISGEEEKLECEPLKILGTLANDQFAPASIRISAQCNRVPVIDGHLECVSLRLSRKASPGEVSKALQSFRVNARLESLPSASRHPIIVREECDRPQSRLDRNAGKGFATVVGRVRPCPLFDVKFVLLSHNLIRGAAGAALLNAELLAEQGLLN
ncbi:MAG TPA: aspartate-semialdehyde dehydrogenase [Candidatus Dormibacteraeota bacterium]|nr:aspartate-semialdehyde dehydrogenase [Candidatus Dormibacteraeota bacterium]